MSDAVGLEPLLSAAELARYLGVEVRTIYEMNYAGTGPTRLRVGRYIRYRSSDVQEWLRCRTINGQTWEVPSPPSRG